MAMALPPPSDPDEPVLVVEAGRHGLVSEGFIRNTAPDWISAEQGGFPVAFRDADLLVEMADDVPDALHEAVDFGAGLILRTDRRLGFDPTADWTLHITAVREHGVFQPQVGSVNLSTTLKSDPRFFARPEVIDPTPPWVDALRNRATDLVILSGFLVALLLLLGPGLNRLAIHPQLTPVRIAILAFVTGFVGWWGQGQLSIVTPLAVARTAMDGGSFAFLLYDPFSLLLWAATIIGFVLWGRGFFCGWLCPFGAMQEFAALLARKLRIRQIPITAAWDNRLKWLKYGVLAALVAVMFGAPEQLDKVVEVEPFKTSVTTFFVRELYYVAYAVGLILLSMVLFMGFCRYLCPLGAVMSIGGLLRVRGWIARREACGNPCQLCKVKCAYGAIKTSGAVDYSECFQCLDCVTIYEDPKQCVPLILEARRKQGRKQRRSPTHRRTGIAAQ